MRIFCLPMLASLIFGCGDIESADPGTSGVIDRGVNRFRDAGVRQPDARRPAPVQDQGVTDAGSDAAPVSEMVFDPSQYVPYGYCPQIIEFVGQSQGEGASVPNGGQPRFSAYPSGYDGGIRNLLNFVPAADGSDDPDPVAVDAQLTAVTVIATRPATEGNVSESQARFWIADALGSIEVYLDLNANSTAPFPIHVGAVIDLRVTQVGRYGGRPQIRTATDWRTSMGSPHPELAPGPNAEVAFLEPDRTLTSADVNRAVRISGLLEGEPESCGSMHQCWPLNYGAGVITIRTREPGLRAGTCVTYAGPLSAFRANVQLETFNPTWTRRYQRGAGFGEACLSDAECNTNLCLTFGDDRFCSLDCETSEDCPTRYSCDRPAGSETGSCLPGGTVQCPASEDVDFTGQIGAINAERPNGGMPRFAPYPADFDAGLLGLIAQIPLTDAEGDPDPVAANIQVTKAIVIATREFTEDDIPESQRVFWVADANGAVEVHLDEGARGGTPNFVVQVGTVISFRATRIGRFQRKPQISAATDWVRHGADDRPHPDLLGSPDGEVQIWTPDRALDLSDAHRIVRITGNLSGLPESCGRGNLCWRLDYGYGEPLILRARSSAHPEASTGSCVTFVGPLGYYRGNLQLDTTNPAWLRVYN